MVPNPGAKTRAGAIKPLNAPVTIEVRADSWGVPSAVRLPASLTPLGARSTKARPKEQPVKANPKRQPRMGPWQEVVSVEDLWKINDEWWRGREEEIERMYFDLLLESGHRITVYHDLIHDQWRRQAG